MSMGKKRNRVFELILCVVLALALLVSAGCTPSASESGQQGSAVNDDTTQQIAGNITGAPVLPGLQCLSVLELEYAEQFSCFYYENGYQAFQIRQEDTYLLVPDGASVPDGLDSSVIVLQKPLSSIYVAATAAMALFDAIDCLDHIKYSSVQAGDWYVENANRAMDEGRIVYAGKYSEPDYELLISQGCDLSVQSTMIYHSPKVKEMLEAMGIPVMVDAASFESHPLGRTEWIKLYGFILGEDEKAKSFFDEQAQIVEDLKDFENTGKTVVYFYISSNGQAVIRSSGDYIAKMINIAGARYAFDGIANPSESSTTVSLSMEEFYATAVNADYLIYNASIDQPIKTMQDLLGKDQLFADFKAVQEGNVWCTERNFYQASDIAARMIDDINLMITNGSEKDMTFLYRVRS